MEGRERKRRLREKKIRGLESIREGGDWEERERGLFGY